MTSSAATRFHAHSICPDRRGATSRFPQTDWHEVLERLAEGDPAAHARVSGVLFALLAKRQAFDLHEMWEDLCQDALIALVRNVRRGAIRNPQAFLGYCAAVLHHLVLRGRTRARNHRTRHVDGNADWTPEEPRVQHDRELILDLQKALAALPGPLRAVVRAIYLEGHSYEEAARSLGLPLGTLKRRQREGLRLLRERICCAGARS